MPGKRKVNKGASMRIHLTSRKYRSAAFTALIVLCFIVCTLFSGCAGKKGGDGSDNVSTDISKSLVYENSMETEYAEGFAVDYYKDGYKLLTIKDEGRYLLVPEGKVAPEDLAEDVKILNAPFDNIYLVASAVMDMFDSIDALDCIRFSGTKKSGWYIDSVIERMSSEEILYAGNYSAPDYELIISEDCDLAIENTMINHAPEVKEQLESFDIPVIVDRSSYEKEPLGRTEWVKFYGALAGKEEAAEKAYNKECKAFAQISDSEPTGKTVAFFYVTNAGEVNVRITDDYIPRMIEQAGGEYVLKNLEGNVASSASTVTMQMEEFYAQAKDADYIIYNSAIDQELRSVNDLIGKNSLFRKFKAVQDDNVYCTTKNLYQASMELGTLINDFHGMLHGEDDMVYVYKLD